MTTNLLRGKSGKAMTSGAMGTAIGETDAQVFDCPKCARPLAHGTSRCPACGVRMVMGVALRRAGAILALGIVVGVLAGGAATTAAITLSLAQPAAPAAVAVEPSVAPLLPSAAPAVLVPGTVLAPPAAISALSGTAVVNGRIAVDATTLATALADRNTPTIEIARAMRSLAADAALGVDLVGRLHTWAEATPVTRRLEDFYRAMAQTAHTALRASIRDAAAYRESGAEMMTVLAALGDVDAASRSLATTIDLELPPVALPGGQSGPAPGASPAP